MPNKLKSDTSKLSSEEKIELINKKYVETNAKIEQIYKDYIEKVTKLVEENKK